jgi:hypothetical protein
MFRIRLALGCLAAVLGLVGCASLPESTPAASENRLPESVCRILDGADRLELISLEPVQGDFYNWKVLGRTQVKHWKMRQKVVRGLYHDIQTSDGSAALCFIPRHAVRAFKKASDTTEERVDLVICYQCCQIRAYDSKGELVASVLTAKSAEPILDGILKEAGVPLAKKAE